MLIPNDLNEMKMMYISFNDGRMIPETLMIDYFQASEIKSRFIVVSTEMKSALMFSNLKSALHFTMLLVDKPFVTREFYDYFRIIEVDENFNILKIIVNLVDFWNIICMIKRGELDKQHFVDEDFNQYYERYINVI